MGGGGLRTLSASRANSARIQARVLGTFEVIVGGRGIERAAWRRRSAERLLKLLLVSPGHCLSRDVAAETLWPGADPETSRSNLRKALYFARRTLTVPEAISSDGDLVRLDAALVRVDLDRLREAFDVLALRRLGRRAGDSTKSSTRQPAEPADAQALATVLELGRRPLLPADPYEEWLADLRENLRSRWQAVAMEAAHDAAASERAADAHAILAQILERDPTDEEAHRLSIDLYAMEGRYHAVRRQFELCRRALAEGLDVTPSTETEAAYRRAELAAHAQPTLVTASRLVGRAPELAVVESTLERAAAGRFAALVIRGPAGIGKTRVLEALRERARNTGWRELAWQALESTRSIPYAPFALRLVDEVSVAELETWEEPARSGLAAIMPGLGKARHLTFADAPALRLAVAAALAHLARRAPRLIAIDDLAALDTASMELLGSASTVLSAERVLVAVAYRDEEPLPEPAVLLLDALRRSAAQEIRLGALAGVDVEALVTAHLGGETLAAPLARDLYERSEGNPLFCLEIAREASSRGAIQRRRECWTLAPGAALGEAPETVRHIVEARSKALPAPARELLRVAAELGQAEIGYETLSVVLRDLPGGVIPALDAALISGLLVERGAGYAFGHPLYRRAVASGAGTPRRADAQFAIACALAGLDREAAADPAKVLDAAAQSRTPALVAEHAMLADELGRSDAAILAVGFGFAAATRARALFDRDVAERLFERAIGVWNRLPAAIGRRFDACDAYANLAELRMANGDDTAAEADFRLAIDAARDPEELAAAYGRLTWLPQRHGDFDAMLALSQEALARLPDGAVVSRAIVATRLAYCMFRLDRLDETIAGFEGAARVLENADKPAALAEALNGLGTALSYTDRAAEGIPILERALALALEQRDGFAELGIRAHLGAALTRAGRAAEARSHFSRAFELGEQIGEHYLSAVCAWLAAEMEEALGNLRPAREMRLRELAMLDQLGGNPHNEAYAHAHLAHLARLLGETDAEQREAARARELAATDPDPAYPARIEAALAVARWSDLPEH